MTEKARKNPNPLQKKKLQQEADSRCPFCGNTEAGTWIFHHIDGDPSHTVLDNLIMVCGACHERITKGEISEADVRLKKNMTSWGYKQRKPAESKIVKNEANGNVGCEIRQTIRIGKLPPDRVAPAPDSIGNNAEARNLVNLLVRKLGDYRLKGHPDRNAKSVFAAINKDLAKHFMATSVPNISISRLNEVISYLQMKIDGTTQGRMNKGKTRKEPK